ncbi:hypothetical protein [Variovorax ginsengisoli]|uniref:Acyl-CoA dehydrogenase n=1 Tax=Variovorax ginsengisoli TaxID=363844 RepID=A0ABT8SCE6_9BURK|nr:hypothetical protein [Variovorax ginsengisoli]MDN8617426.1 hypothetical protein [Variovorax ginsengisoli]MDO1536596.1 hypothetical protein [Variovorax ginsengisoli]
MTVLVRERELNSLLHGFLDTGELLHRDSYPEHNGGVFDALLEAARGMGAAGLFEGLK